MLKLRFGGTSPAINTATQALGAERGLYQESGLDLEVNRLNNDIQILQAIVGNQIDVATAGPAAVLGAIESGTEVTILGTEIRRLTFMMFSKDDVTSAQDLSTRAIGITAPNSLPHVLAQGYLITSGVDPKTPNYVQLQDPTAAFQALIAGSIDATPSRIDYLQRSEAAGNLKVLSDLGEAMPRFIQQSIFASNRVIQENPEAIKRYLIGTAKSVRFQIANKAETVEIVARLTGQPEADVAFLHDWMVQAKAWNPNLEFPPESLAWMQDLNVQLGLQKAVQPTEKVLAPQFQRQAIAELGEAPI